MSCNCDHESNSNSGFVFGIILGAIIGAAVAIYIYKNNKSDIFENLKKKLEGYFKEAPPKPHKIPVTIPKEVEVLDITPPKTKKKAVLFKK